MAAKLISFSINAAFMVIAFYIAVPLAIVALIRDEDTDITDPQQ